ncbi:MAG: hypothetical protein JO257_21030 [Deltaproteobacteria bacterium]|nr:hypothetical protein [Deltaproteobacteria bacterium]
MRIAPTAQGVFYIATGLWPILHLRSFLRVTGPKRDTWLVQTLGGLIAAVGAALLVDKSRTLGIASAMTLGVADVTFAGKGRISPVYFADAVAEGALAALWL